MYAFEQIENFDYAAAPQWPPALSVALIVMVWPRRAPASLACAG